MAYTGNCRRGSLDLARTTSNSDPQDEPPGWPIATSVRDRQTRMSVR